VSGGQIRAFVALEEGVERDAIGAVLPPAEDIDVLGYADGLPPSWGELDQSPADLVIVACAPGSEPAIALIGHAVGQRPDRPVVVFQVGLAETNGFMNQVFAAGADDIVALPETPERVRHALLKAIARKRGTTLAKGGAPARLICVLGPKGGTGKTVTTTNLGVALAKTGLKATIVDLDLRFGDVGLGLRLSPDRTIYDLARSAGSLDADKLEGFLVSHESGARVLLAPTRPDHAGAISTSFVAEVLAILRATSEIVVVDTPAGFPPEVITSIDSSTDICMLGMLDAFSLKDTKLGLETLDLMGYDRGSIRIVLNRADSHVGIGHQDVKAILGRTPDVLIPSDRDIPRSVTEGIPIVSSLPRSDAGKAYWELAAQYAEVPAGAPDAAAAKPSHRRKSLLRRA
jgi:Flp pilus assembly CpaE family ATPase